MANDPSLIHKSFPKQGDETPVYMRSGSSSIYGSPPDYDLSKPSSMRDPASRDPLPYREDRIENEKSSFDKKVRS
jgi:hypothetical protein